MYELVILGFLMRGPFHGYRISKIINDMIGPFARLSNGRLYPLLSKLQQEGLIAPASEPTEGALDHQHRSFVITAAGRERFYDLMLDTTSNPGDYTRIFWFKLPYLLQLEPADRLYLLDHYINFCQTHLFHITNEIGDLERKAAQAHIMSAEELEVTVGAMRHYRDRWQLELESVRSWRAREVAKMEELILPGDAATDSGLAPRQPSAPAQPSRTPSTGDDRP
jgi:DNA-binding PadR family transcriptional regulator